MALPANLPAYRGGGKYNVGGNVVPFGGGGYSLAGGQVHFNAGAFTAVVLNSLQQRLEACGALWVEMAKANFTFVYPPHSMPWDFPHHSGDKDSMVNSIDYTVFDRGAEMVMQAGIIDYSLPGRLSIYPRMLETGTRFMAPRPWVTITTDEVWNDWGTILTGMGS